MAVYLFSGSFEHSLDGKGRVIIPSDFRETLGDLFTITINPRRTAIAVYPKEVWKEKMEKLAKVNPMDEKGMRYVRYVMSLSFSGNSVDLQGRVIVPQKLRQKLGFKKDIVFIGMPNCIEIWDAEAYRKVETEAEDDFDDMADYMLETYSPAKE